MANWKAINGNFTTAGVDIRVNEYDADVSVPLENISGPGMTNGDRADYRGGNKTYSARLRGKAYSAGFIYAVGGSFTAPSGINVKLSRGRVRKTWPLENTTGPGDSGTVQWDQGIPTYSAGLLGWTTGTIYQASSVAPDGTLTIKAGSNNEEITGTAVIRNLRTDSNYRRGNVIPCSLSAIYQNDAAITAGNAAMLSASGSGTLTVQVGDQSGVAGTDYQQLTGSVVLRSIEFQYDFAAGLPVDVEFEARWTVSPV